MADNQKTVIVTLRADSDDLKRKMSEVNLAITKLRTEITSFKAAQKEAIDQGNIDRAGELSRVIVEQETQLKGLNDQYRQLGNLSKTTAGSMAELKAQTALMKAELDDMAPSTEEERKAFLDLSQAIEVNKTAIRDYEVSIGNLQANVGNYAKGVQEGIDSSLAFEQTISLLTQALENESLTLGEQKAIFAQYKQSLDNLTTSQAEQASKMAKSLEQNILFAQGKVDEFGNRIGKGNKELFNNFADLGQGIAAAYSIAPLLSFGDAHSKTSQAEEKALKLIIVASQLKALATAAMAAKDLVEIGVAKAKVLFIKEEILTTQANTAAIIENTAATEGNAEAVGEQAVAKEAQAVATTESTVATEANTVANAGNTTTIVRSISSLGLWGIAIAAVVAAGYTLYKLSPVVKQFFNDVADTAKEAAQGWAEWVGLIDDAATRASKKMVEAAAQTIDNQKKEADRRKAISDEDIRREEINNDRFTKVYEDKNKMLTEYSDKVNTSVLKARAAIAALDKNANGKYDEDQIKTRTELVDRLQALELEQKKVSNDIAQNQKDSDRKLAEETAKNSQTLADLRLNLIKEQYSKERVQIKNETAKQLSDLDLDLDKTAEQKKKERDLILAIEKDKLQKVRDAQRLEQAASQEQARNAYLNGQTDFDTYQLKLLAIQENAAQVKLSILKRDGLSQTEEAKKAANDILQIQQEYAQKATEIDASRRKAQAELAGIQAGDNVPRQIEAQRAVLLQQYRLDYAAAQDNEEQKKLLTQKYLAEDAQLTFDSETYKWQRSATIAANALKNKNDLLVATDKKTQYEANQEQLQLEVDALKDRRDVLAAAGKDTNDITQQIEERNTQILIEQAQLRKQVAEQLRKDVEDLLTQAFEFRKVQLDNELNAVEGNYKKQSDALESANKAGAISNQLYKKQKDALDASYNNKTAQIKKEQFITDKREHEAKIIMDTAEAIIKVNTSVPPPFSIPLQVAIGALGAAQLAVVEAQQPPQYAKGGRLAGPLHAQGGIMAVAGGKPIAEVEGGEYIVNRRSTAAWFPALEAINNSLPKMSSGGPLNPALRQQVPALNAEDIARAVASMPIYTQTKDTLESINRVSYTQTKFSK